MGKTRSELERRLAELQQELGKIRVGLKDLAEKGRSAVRRGKDARDKSQLDDVRKKLGL